MTHDEIAKVAIWAVDMGDKYNIEISRVIETFKAINKFHPNIETVKNMMEKGYEETKRGAISQ